MIRYLGKRVLVTGGAGFIGSLLVERLVAAGAEVVALDNFYRGRRDSLAECSGVRIVEGDIRCANHLAEVMDGVDTVFHLAAQSQVRTALADPRYCFETNVGGTFSVLEAAKAARVRRLVFTSSREVYGDADDVPVVEEAPLKAKNGYGLSKVAGELYCRQYSGDLDVSILRLSNVYGPRDFGRVIPIFMRQALAGEPLALFGGKQVCDFVWVGTVVQMLLTAGLRQIQGPLNIGSGRPVSLEQLAERILRLTASTSQLQFQPEISAEVTRFVADVTRASRQLGLSTPLDPLFGLPAVLARLSAEIPGDRRPAMGVSRKVRVAAVG